MQANLWKYHQERTREAIRGLSPSTTDELLIETKDNIAIITLNPGAFKRHQYGHAP